MPYKTDTNTQNTSTNSSPIVSTILKDEPEYADLIEIFVGRLPSTVSRVMQYFSEKNWPQFRKEIHDLKGMGGSYGFPMITVLASEIGIQYKYDNFAAVQNLLQELQSVSARIVMGMAKHAQKCA